MTNQMPENFYYLQDEDTILKVATGRIQTRMPKESWNECRDLENNRVIDGEETRETCIIVDGSGEPL